MTSGAVWKVILRFAFPLLIGNLLQQLYNVTDSVIVGQFLGKESLAAVSASFFIYYFIISLVIGIGSGTSVVISQFFGAKEFDKVQKAFSSFFIFMLSAGAAGRNWPGRSHRRRWSTGANRSDRSRRDSDSGRSGGKCHRLGERGKSV